MPIGYTSTYDAALRPRLNVATESLRSRYLKVHGDTPQTRADLDNTLSSLSALRNNQSGKSETVLLDGPHKGKTIAHAPDFNYQS